MPTSLAVNCSITLADRDGTRDFGVVNDNLTQIAVTTSRFVRHGVEYSPGEHYVGRVSEQNSDQPIDENEEITYLRSTPVETVLGNHFFVLLQLAAVHLATTPPDLAAAQLVIDTVAAMLQAGGDRLGEHINLYRNALAEVQQVYVRATTQTPKS
jgi:hypothetical protein